MIDSSGARTHELCERFQRPRCVDVRGANRTTRGRQTTPKAIGARLRLLDEDYEAAPNLAPEAADLESLFIGHGKRSCAPHRALTPSLSCAEAGSPNGSGLQNCPHYAPGGGLAAGPSYDAVGIWASTSVACDDGGER
jgi:hypothetical protein